MHVIRLFIPGIILMTLLVSCTTTSVQQKGRVQCPACGAEFDALYQKHF